VASLPAPPLEPAPAGPLPLLAAEPPLPCVAAVPSPAASVPPASPAAPPADPAGPSSRSPSADEPALPAVAALPAGVPPAEGALPPVEAELPPGEPVDPAGAVPAADGPDPEEPGDDEPSAPLDGDPLDCVPLEVWPDWGLGIGIVDGLPEEGLLCVGNEEDWPPGDELGEGMLEGEPPPLGDGGEGMAVPPEDGWVGVDDDGQPASASDATAIAALVAPRREIRSGLAMVGTPRSAANARNPSGLFDGTGRRGFRGALRQGEPAAVPPPSRKLPSWSARRSQAVPWTRAISGTGTMTPTRAEVPVTFADTTPAVLASFRSQTKAS
jgi:hypothetical protein